MLSHVEVGSRAFLSLQSALRNTSLHARSKNPLRLIMQIYFDESGEFNDSDFICVCGFLASDQQWKDFNTAWSVLLDKYKSVFKFVHMTEFPSQCKLQGWGEKQTESVLCEFVDVIREHVHTGFAVGIDAKHWTTKFRQTSTPLKDPALFAIHRVLKRVSIRFDEEQHPGFLSLLFDECGEYSIRCHKIISRLRKRPQINKLIISIAFCDDKYFTPIQAADVFANLSTRYFRDEGGPKCGPPTGPLAQLLTSPVPGFMLDCRTEYWNEGEIDKNWKDIVRAGI